MNCLNGRPTRVVVRPAVVLVTHNPPTTHAGDIHRIPTDLRLDAAVGVAESWSGSDQGLDKRWLNPRRLLAAPVRLKVPPHSNEAEQSLLGGLMLDEHAWDKVADKLGPADFYLPQHRIIFEVMADLANTNKPLDIVTLSGALSTRAILDRVGGNAVPHGTGGRHARHVEPRDLRGDRQGAVDAQATDPRRQRDNRYRLPARRAQSSAEVLDEAEQSASSRSARTG